MLPSAKTPRETREEREQAAIARIDARLASGEITPEQADAEILEIALQRFAFLPPSIVDELRAMGRELFEEPEMVVTRRFAPRPDDES